jgi:FlaA1/EpsC-like NDP-sugar epimerase
MGMVFCGCLVISESYWVGFELNMHFNVIVLYLTTTIFFFWIFRTYSSVIRHSTFNDLIKIFAAQSATFHFFLLNTGFENFQGQKLF